MYRSHKVVAKVATDHDRYFLSEIGSAHSLFLRLGLNRVLRTTADISSCMFLCDKMKRPKKEVRSRIGPFFRRTQSCPESFLLHFKGYSCFHIRRFSIMYKIIFLLKALTSDDRRQEEEKACWPRRLQSSA